MWAIKRNKIENPTPVATPKRNKNSGRKNVRKSWKEVKMKLEEKSIKKQTRSDEVI